MPGVVDPNGPSYISSHSADVILSEIRPFKLKADALRVINVLLDEFLYKILSTSCSLATDKLRASLLNLLPTSLGKEALLEAEVELRAYWERRDPRAASDDDAQTFHLQWAFELLRLKCEAYSTLNEQDEDPVQEARIHERFNKSHPYPPVPTLVDPAALYLTAILESMCEHILSNVGRVAARDSSRTYAHVNDLFVALCEDGSIYSLFKTMKVYEQIESMSMPPKTRRSKSFSRSDLNSISRTSSPHNELTPVNSGTRSRQSSEGTLPPATPANGSRSSFEKGKAMRMFASKYSGEGEAPNGHKKSESIKSEHRSLVDEEGPSVVEDAAMLREFDDLMRSASTMKVSLTPDRLKTMEVYKQEKDSRTSKRPNHFPSHSEPDFHPTSRSNSQRPSLRQVEAIVEDEEEQSPKQPRPRQISVATPPTSLPPATVLHRSRSQSTSSGLPSSISRKPVRAPSIASSTSTAPSAYTQPPRSQQSPSMHNHAANGFPARTRVKQRNRESMDLDDIMNGSDDDAEPTPSSRKPVNSSVPSTPARTRPPAVSAKTRELMDFLAEGPPEPKVSHSGRDMMDFLSDGPPDYAQSSISLEKQKPAGRLQRMISKLNLGNEKAKATQEPPRVSTPTKVSATPINTKAYVTSTPSGALASLANRPIPPRPHLVSPPHSPSNDSLNENRGPSVYPQEPAQRPPERPHVERVPASSPPPLVTTLTREKSDRHSPRTTMMPPPGSPSYPSYNVNGNGNPRPAPVKDTDHKPIIPTRTVSHSSIPRKPVPPVVVATPVSPTLAESDIRDMRRLLASATTADECRLIVDIFMTRSGLISNTSKEQDVPYPSPPPSVIKRTPAMYDPSLEASIIDHFLSGTSSLDSERLVQPGRDAPADVGRPDSTPNNIHKTPIGMCPTEAMTPVSVAV